MPWRRLFGPKRGGDLFMVTFVFGILSPGDFFRTEESGDCGVEFPPSCNKQQTIPARNPHSERNREPGAREPQAKRRFESASPPRRGTPVYATLPAKPEKNPIASAAREIEQKIIKVGRESIWGGASCHVLVVFGVLDLLVS